MWTGRDAECEPRPADLDPRSSAPPGPLPELPGRTCPWVALPEESWASPEAPGWVCLTGLAGWGWGLAPSSHWYQEAVYYWKKVYALSQAQPEAFPGVRSWDSLYSYKAENLPPAPLAQVAGKTKRLLGCLIKQVPRCLKSSSEKLASGIALSKQNSSLT